MSYTGKYVYTCCAEINYLLQIYKRYWIVLVNCGNSLVEIDLEILHQFMYHRGGEISIIQRSPKSNDRNDSCCKSSQQVVVCVCVVGGGVDTL